MSKLLASLNARQRAVVLHDKGPLRVIACAGSGKTATLVYRVAYLVEERQVDPARVLAVTFTKKAADEMNVRLRRMLKKTKARIGTFHSVGLELVRESGCTWEVDGEGSKYRKLVTDVLVREKAEVNYTDVLDYIARCKAHAEKPGSKEAQARAQRFLLGPYSALLHDYYVLAERERNERQFLTFDDQLLDGVSFLEGQLDWFADRYDYVLQDEAQDASPVQIRMACAFSHARRNYMVVGDPMQCIYQFRSASPRTLTHFHEEWPDVTDIQMTSNYRSGLRIVDAANGLLAALGASYQMTAERPVPGRVEVSAYEDQHEEAAEVVAQMKEIRQNGESWGSMAVLYRMHTQSRAIEDALVRAQIPYTIAGAGAFYRRQEIVALLSYLRAALAVPSWEDVKPSLRMPFRYVGKSFFVLCEELSEGTPVTDWPSFLRELAQSDKHLRRNLEPWARLVSELRDELMKSDRQPKGEETRPVVLLERVLHVTQFKEWLTKERGSEGPEDLHQSSIQDLLKLAETHETVSSLLEYVDAMSDRIERVRGDTGDRVVLSSIHGGKGLEWNHVWIVSCNEGVMPHVHAIHGSGDAAEDDENDALDEERRLAYVAVTRARDDLHLSWVRTPVLCSTSPTRPSRFLEEAGLG